MAADSSAGFCAPPNDFYQENSAPQTDSGVGINGPDGLQIPTQESVWDAESLKEKTLSNPVAPRRACGTKSVEYVFVQY